VHARLGCCSHMMIVKPCVVHAAAVTAWVAAAECTTAACSWTAFRPIWLHIM